MPSASSGLSTAPGVVRILALSSARIFSRGASKTTESCFSDAPRRASRKRCAETLEIGSDTCAKAANLPLDKSTPSRALVTNLPSRCNSSARDLAAGGVLSDAFGHDVARAGQRFRHVLHAFFRIDERLDEGLGWRCKRPWDFRFSIFDFRLARSWPHPALALWGMGDRGMRLWRGSTPWGLRGLGFFSRWSPR